MNIPDSRTSTASRSYRIVVRGGLSDRFRGTFGDMVLQRREGETVLTGAVRDQAQLFGILDQIQRFGVELVSVNPVDEPAGGPVVSVKGPECGS